MPMRRENFARRITPQIMAFYKQRAHQLRAEAYVNAGHALWALMKRIVRQHSDCRALRLRPAQMFIEPRHDLHEIARAIAIVELVHEDLIPRVPAGARRAG